MTDYDPILGLAMPPNEHGAATVRGYLREMIRKMWRQGGAPPEGWRTDLTAAVIAANAAPDYAGASRLLDQAMGRL